MATTRLRVLQLNVGERLVTETCYACGVLFAMVEDFYNHRQADKKTFYCPNGHGQCYTGKTDTEKLREERERAATRERALQDQLRAANRDAEATRVALLRDRQRFVDGLCPCCNRSFGNVRRHMANEHPDYDVAKVQQPGFECSCGAVFATHRGLRIHQGRMRGDDWDDPKTPRTHTWGGSHLTEVGAR